MKDSKDELILVINSYITLMIIYINPNITHFMLYIFNLSIQDSTPYSIILSVSPSITTVRSNEACFDKPARIGFFKLRNHILWKSLQQNIVILLLCPRFSKREIIVLWVNQKISFIYRLSLVIPDYRGRKGRSSLYSRGG